VICFGNIFLRYAEYQYPGVDNSSFSCKKTENSSVFLWKFFTERETIGLDISVGPHAVDYIRCGAVVINQNYFQCYFFRPSEKDRDMHRKKPQSARVYRIGEAARILDLHTSVLRFWEGEFLELDPVRTPKGQRLYSEKDMALLFKIRSLLHEQGMTIEGARRILSGNTESPAALAERRNTAHAAGTGSENSIVVLREIVHELKEVRALLASDFSKEKCS
jgi:DNA-binding transcriptional MerR regulator